MGVVRELAHHVPTSHGEQVRHTAHAQECEGQKTRSRISDTCMKENPDKHSPPLISSCKDAVESIRR